MLLEQFKNGALPAGVSDREMWEALKVKQVWFTDESVKLSSLLELLAAQILD